MKSGRKTVFFLILVALVVFLMNQWLPQPGPNQMANLVTAIIKGLGVLVAGALFFLMDWYLFRRKNL